ncbi:MAG: chromosomal replication initiator protein DnaA [Thermomicrobiales bacterium]
MARHDTTDADHSVGTEHALNGSSNGGHESTRPAEPVDTRKLWKFVLLELERKVSRTAFDNWVRHTAIGKIEGDQVVVTGPNVFSVQTIQSRYANHIEAALSSQLGRTVSAHFAVAGQEANALNRIKPASSSSRSDSNGSAQRRGQAASAEGSVGMKQGRLEPATSGGLNPRLRYDNYVVGSSNQLAHAASLAVAENPGHLYNPLFVYGGVGLGKTHLLHSIGHRALELNASLTILYVTSETFTNEVINAIRSQKMDDFRARYRSIDILMIDDIQFIAGKESTQEEFFHTFNTLYQNGKHVVISSDKPPRAIASLEERMRSRFEGGLIADVQSPDYEMRTAILRAKGEELKVNLPDDVVQYVAHKDQTNIRELEGALNKILMMAQLYRRPLTLQLAMESLTDASISQRRAGVTIQDVVSAVTTYFKVSEKDLSGRNRKREIVVPRQIAMYLLREETTAPLKDIGRALGDRDHTTVLHGIEKVEQNLEKDSVLRTQVMAIRESLITRTRT